ncbi:MAG: DUF1566 domain-containing protein [Deltaproteobacteria bacterium]|nr:DUF1566 domain-containing protein [Deltaproteobacteria bacterium]
MTTRPLMNVVIFAAAGVFLAAATPAGAAGTPEQQCQAAKNKAAGAYATCRQKAEAALATSGDATKYNAALAKCGAKVTSAWQKAIAKAANVSATCLDDPLTVGDFQGIIDAHTDNVATALGGGGLTDCSADLATCNGDLTTCNGDLTSCNADLGTCNGDLATCGSDLAQSQTDLASCNGSLGTCNGNLSSCSASLTTCNANYASCSADLATVNAGTAVAADVLAGKTFSSGAGLGLTGTMPNNGAVNVTPGTAPQAIAAGYHNGAGAVAGDADLVAGNVKNGVDLFGVTGTLLNPPLKTGQTTSYGAGSDGDLQKGVARSFTDNGDGTITDNTTGLMWEKKSDDGSIHDKDNAYTWGMTSPPYTMNGTMVTTFLAGLNGGGGFAGHTDWRIPNVNELQSLANYQNVNPAVAPAFNTACAASCTVTTCSCTQSNYYWSSTTYQYAPGNAWYVNFNVGYVFADFKSNDFYVRAVRGGS